MAKTAAELKQMVSDRYHFSDKTTEHGERLHRKHHPVMKKFARDFDYGRAHGVLTCIALLRGAGHNKAADKIEPYLDWMCEPPTKAAPRSKTIADAITKGR